MASKDISPLTSPTLETEHVCNLCSHQYEQPRILSCLHVYCESCLEKLLQGTTDEKLEDELISVTGALICPDCGQETKISNKGVSGLHLDYVLCNQLDITAIENMQIVCTSCKAKEKAVARCTDCATFLCSNCVTAHQYMRCFENHKVVSFEDMKSSSDGIAIHKPITCSAHSGESLKYYCHTCEVPICNECMVIDHKQPDHQYERASDVEQKHREELENLMTESKSKVQFCEEATSVLQTCLSELQLQRDNAKSLIEETFQSYKVILEKCQEEIIQELKLIHSAQELHIMDTFHNVEKTIEKIEDAWKFTDRLLKHGNTIEILSLKQLVGAQLLYLINNTPKPDINVEITFETNKEKFEEAVKDSFGSLRKPESPLKVEEATPIQQPSPLHSSSSFESEGFVLPSGVLHSDTSVPSSLDMDLANNVVAQYNLAQLAGMAERSASRGSPNPVLAISDLLIPANSTDCASQLNTLSNFSALAKLGSVSLNNSGQILLNGQVVPGLTLDSMSQLRSPVTPASGNHSHPIRSMQHTPQSPLDNGLNNLLNGGVNLSPSSTTPIQRGGSPHLDSPILNGSPTMNVPFSRNIPPSPLLPSNSILSSLPGQPAFNPPPRSSTSRLNTMQIRCKFGQLGPAKGQFSSPHGFCLGLDEEIIVADTNNHRIQVFDKVGEFKYQFGIPGKEEGQLWYPRKVAVIRSSGKFVICDRGSERSRMQLFTKTGHFIKKIAIRYIDIVAGLAITGEGNIVAVDSVSPTVFVIAESGELVRWFDCSEYMREPSDIAISGKEYYICDFKGHCVIVFSEDGQFVRRIGCENITNFPNGIDISDAGDVLVGDSHGNRFHVVVFSREGSILSEFECPYVKVSRCCGLKITSEGYIVTLAKNNHHMLILNTLYIM
ncbi:B-box type zinc finger protein ncl-1 [Centruroides vittatus]|uniref:B-box type zinc finger protein ncl-1 n=2 Tax=Centruroides TaxID=6875 RepID=UPI000C6CD450|nr:brain tumor protein-like isoform X2 [Centruroides sculpturatus]